ASASSVGGTAGALGFDFILFLDIMTMFNCEKKMLLI
ncbi:MAG: hypothetical protein RL662_1413, partial [Bacteroidota bacterium]